MIEVDPQAIERYRQIAAAGDRDLDRWCYKEVSHDWLGVSCRYALSHSAFSSDRIDDGSKLLLHALASRIAVPERWSGCSVYDIGCGVGVLGIAAAASLGAARLVLEDRDSFSVATSCLNAWKNGLRAEIVPNPAPTGVRSFGLSSLVLCNLPAKAGPAVHRLMFEHAVSHLTVDGIAAFVVVQTLASAVERELAALPVNVERVDGAGHAVFLLRRSSAGTAGAGAPEAGRAKDENKNAGEDGRKDGRKGGDAFPGLPAAYIGERARFTIAKAGYSLRVIEGLPEFDSPSFITRMLVKLATDYGPDTPVLALDNGPGHLAAVLANRGSTVCCASRNALAGYAHEQFVFKTGRTGARTTHSVLAERPGVLTSHVPAHGLVVLPVVVDPYTPVFDELTELLEQVRRQGSHCILAGSSLTISRLEKRKLPLSIRRRARSRGVRGLVLAPA